MTARNSGGGRRSRHWGAPLLALWLGIGVVGCDSLLDVENPNNVVGEDVVKPTAQAAVANGALFTVEDAFGDMLAPYSTVSDELTWIGSRDAWLELDNGTPDNPANEFVDGSFPQFAQGRWMADEAIEILEMHRDSAVLNDPNDLARTYLYAAIMYVVIADWFDDFAFSDRKVAGPPIGEAGMGQLYTTAIGYVDNGLAIVAGSGKDLERNLVAMRARARHAQAVWNMIGVRPISIGNPLVNDASAVADAQAAVAMDASDWVYEFEYDASTLTPDVGWQVNERLELRFSNDYIVPAADDNTRDLSAPDRGVALKDLIDNVGDPRLDEIMTAFEAQRRYVELTILSAREMNLILAEAALASGNMASFETYINTVRVWGNVTAFVNGGAGMPTAQDLLIHERRVNLFLQGRRLNDMYRFGIQSTNWQPTRSAVTNPGTFLPITKIEIDANCHISPDFECEG